MNLSNNAVISHNSTFSPMNSITKMMVGGGSDGGDNDSTLENHLENEIFEFTLAHLMSTRKTCK